MHMRSSAFRLARSPLGFTVALLLCMVPPAPLQGQQRAVETHDQIPFRNLLDVQFLAGVPEDGASFTPSLRVALQRRAGLGWSWSVAGLYLQDALSATPGLALGGSLALDAGPVLLEPFVELGGGITDARVADGSYNVFLPGGGQETIQRYRAVDGFASLGGAGVGVSWISGGGLLTRLGLGYWHVQAGDGLSRGSVRAALSLGLARRDEVWYGRATDRIPPSVLIMGRSVAEGDSVRVEDGGVVVYARDDSGIRRILVNGEEYDLAAVDGRDVSGLGFSEPGVVAAQVPVTETPFEGAELRVRVQDEGRQVTQLDLRAFGPDDVEPPVVTGGGDVAFMTGAAWHLQAVARDFAGIADARVGFCSMEVFQPVSLAGTAATLGPTDRIVAGWGSFGPGSVLRIRDRAGNVTQEILNVQYPQRPLGNASPVVLDMAAVTGAGRNDGQVSVRIRGRVTDPAGGWIQRVTVNDESALLQATSRGPQTVDFGGWLTVEDGARTVTVTATTADGRSVTELFNILAAETMSEGRRYLVVIGDVPATDQAAPDRLVQAFEEAGADLQVQTAGSRAEAVEVFRELARETGPADVIWVHMVGELSGLPSDYGARMAFREGAAISLNFLEDQIRRLDAGVTLVSNEWSPGRTWRVLPEEAPGQNAPPGCIGTSKIGWGSVLSLGRQSPDRLLAALLDAADLDGDGVVRAVEFSDALTGAPPGGLHAADPLIPLIPAAGAEEGVR